MVTHGGYKTITIWYNPKMFRSVFLFLTALSLLADSGEWSFAPPLQSVSSLHRYFDTQGAPDVFIDTECSKNGVCKSVIKNHLGQTLRSYGENMSVTLLASTRYKHKAYLYYSVSYPKHTHSYLIDEKGKNYTPPPIPPNIFDALITPNGALLSVTPKGIYRNAALLLKAPLPLADAKLQNDLGGDIAAIARSENNEVFTSNTKAWSLSKTKLAARGDKRNILAVFPKNDHTTVYAFYKYVNVYNKGIVLGRSDLHNHHDTSGWLFNSQKRNIGFDPQLFIDEEERVHIVAKESTHDRWVEFVVNYHDIDALQNVVPKHIRGFEEENDLSFLVGTALSFMQWDAKNTVLKERGGVKTTPDYKIASSTFLSYYLQGRYKETRLALAYLQNKAQKQEGIASQASKYLVGTIDLGNFFSSTSTLRLVVEQGKINALASIEDPNSVLNYDTSVGISEEIRHYSLLLLQERGVYYGFDYATFTMPSLLGFGESGNVRFCVFDPKTQISRYALEVGYDELSYAKRYESALSRFYIQGAAGIGIGYIDYSDDVATIIESTSRSLGYAGVAAPLTFVLEGSVDVGYIYQERAKLLDGLGLAWQIGVKASGSYYFSNSSAKNEEDTKLTLQYDRYDLWYGPYVSLNLIF